MDTGGKIRTGKLLEQLSRHAEITLVSNVEHPQDDPYLGDIDRLCARFLPVPWHEPRRHTLSYYGRLLTQSARSLPISALNDFSRELKRTVESELARRPYDVAICDFVQSALIFRDVSSVPTVLFQHNVESEIPQRHIQQSSNPFARLFWRMQWHRMRRFEGTSSARFDTVIAVSERDADRMRSLYGLDNVETIPTGVDTDFYQSVPDSESTPGELVFCGSMDWLPNQDAITFFVNDVLPIVRRSVPEARLTVVGRNPSPALERLARVNPGVTLTGWVQDTRPHIAKGQVFVVPIRVGGGTRMKVYEGMAMGRAVVSTSVGAEGLDYDRGRNIIIADGAEAFAAAIVSLVRDAAQRRSVAEAGREHVTNNYSWSRVAEVFLGVCRRTARV